MRNIKLAFVSVFVLLAVLGCSEKKEDASPVVLSAQDPQNYLYVASGTSYAGLAVVLAAPLNVVVKYTVDGEFVAILRDYTATGGDTPVALVDYNETSILVLVENTAGDRVEIVQKDGSGYTTLFTHASLTGIMRDLKFDYSGGLLVSKATAIEKFTASGARIAVSGAAYVNAPGGACATATSNFTSIAKGPDDQIIGAHSFTAASPNNKVVMISKTGYAAAGDCLATITPPTTAYFPTSLLMHSSGLLLVGYGNNTGPIHQVYSYTVSGNTFGTGVQAFNDISVLQGITRMIELPDQSVLITASANGISTIEKFTLDTATGLLSRVGTTSFLGPTLFTRSVSAMLVAY